MKITLGTYYLILWLGFSFSGCTNGQPGESILPKSITLHPGDLVLRRGEGIISHAVLAADTGCVYSHIGIVVDSCGVAMIVHAVFGESDFAGDKDGVKMDSPTIFFAKDRATKGCILRCRDSRAARFAAVKAWTLYKRGVPFDYGFDSSDSTRMYCSELIEDAYLSTGHSITNGKRHQFHLPRVSLKNIILPSDFLRSPQLECIARF